MKSAAVSLHPSFRPGLWQCRTAPFYIARPFDTRGSSYRIYAPRATPAYDVLNDSGFNGLDFPTLRDARQALTTLLAFHWTDTQPIRTKLTSSSSTRYDFDVVDRSTGETIGHLRQIGSTWNAVHCGTTIAFRARTGAVAWIASRAYRGISSPA